MNYRKDIYEKVKFMLKDKSNVNINCSKIARQYGCDRRTVSKAINAVKKTISHHQKRINQEKLMVQN